MVQLSKYFVWFVSLFAVATSLIACSDDADEGTLLPEMVGDWDIVDSYEAIYIDGKSTVSVSTSVLRDRSMLIAEGMVGVYLMIDPKASRLVSTPIVESKGFISSNKRGLQRKASEVIGLEVERLMNSGKKVTYSDIKQTVRTITNHFLYREAHRSPMVIPVILTYNGGVDKDSSR